MLGKDSYMNLARHSLCRKYLGAVVALGSAVLCCSCYTMAGAESGWMVLALGALLGGSLALKIPGAGSKVSASDVFVFANGMLFGPGAGAVTAALDGLAGSLRSKTKARRAQYAAFNVGAMGLSGYAAGAAYAAVQGLGVPGGPLVPAAALAGVYYVCNAGFVAGMVALDQGRNIWRVWREHFLWMGLSYVTAAAGAGMLALRGGRMTPVAVAAALGMLGLTQVSHRRYLTELAERLKLKELHGLYLIVAEALVGAIGAKDRQEQGRVTRVRLYAQELARAIGMGDEEIRGGMEPAALLHDVGKLAVPEEILSKPGRLTEAEYEKVKEHPAAGVSVLGEAGFRYPVREYIRHHHERWDGTGYPDGLRGEEIPLGARVLAVADSYEALTSDRPYRDKQSREEALEELRAMAGKHYDPELVAKFAEILPKIDVQLQRTLSQGAEELRRVLLYERLARMLAGAMEEAPVR